jgi:hypothetical protein
MPKMPRNLPAVKLAAGSRNPYPKEELTANPPCLFIKNFFLLFFSFNNLQNAQMPRNLPSVKLATGSRNPDPIEVWHAFVTLYISFLSVLFRQ